MTPHKLLIWLIMILGTIAFLYAQGGLSQYTKIIKQLLAAKPLSRFFQRRGHPKRRPFIITNNYRFVVRGNY